MPQGGRHRRRPIAGIQAAKRTHELIPLCHQLPLTFVGVEVTLHTASGEIELIAEARTTARTGVEWRR